MDNAIKFYTMEEVAKYLQVSRDTILSLIKDKKFPAHKVGKQWRFDLKEVDSWVKENN